jgi:hypothetical protein
MWVGSGMGVSFAKARHPGGGMENSGSATRGQMTTLLTQPAVRRISARDLVVIMSQAIEAPTSCFLQEKR